MSKRLKAKIKTHIHTDDNTVFALSDSIFNVMVWDAKGLIHDLAYGGAFDICGVGMYENGLDAIIDLVAGRNCDKEKHEQFRKLAYELFYENVNKNFGWEDDDDEDGLERDLSDELLDEIPDGLEMYKSADVPEEILHIFDRAEEN